MSDILINRTGDTPDDVDNRDIVGGAGFRELVEDGLGSLMETPNAGSGSVGSRSGIDYDAVLPDHMGAMQRFELTIADPMTLDVVVQRVIDGDSLKSIAKSWKIPVARFVAWISQDEKRLLAYENALRVRADELMHETLEIAVGRVEKDAEGEIIGISDVARDKLLVDTHMKLAAKWDKQRYGDEKAAAGAGITIVINRGRYEAESEGETVVVDG